MCADRRVEDVGWLMHRAVVGYHPRDGRPVACWVACPAASAPGAVAQAADLAATLGLSGDLSDGVNAVADCDAVVQASGGWATMRSGGRVHGVARCDDLWSSALWARGLMVVVVVHSPALAETADAAAIADLITRSSAHAGVVRVG